MPRGPKKEEEPERALPTAIPDFLSGGASSPTTPLHGVQVTTRRQKDGALVRDVVLEMDLSECAASVSWPGNLSVFRSAVVQALSGGVAFRAALDPHLGVRGMLDVLQNDERSEVAHVPAVIRRIAVQAAENVARIRWYVRFSAGSGYGNRFDDVIGSSLVFVASPDQQALPLPAPKPPMALVQDLPPEADEEVTDDE